MTRSWRFKTLPTAFIWNGTKPVVAITGSAGKTTAKELTAHVLAASGRKVLRNIKNYNNGLGLPITVMKLAADKSYDVAVLEMGMSTPMNEIARLCRITPPDVAVELMSCRSIWNTSAVSKISPPQRQNLSKG